MAPDLIRLCLVTLLALATGMIIGHAGWTVSLALLLYLLWQQRQLVRLLRWIENKKSNEPPEHAGIFEFLAIALERMRSRHKKRKKKLAEYLKQFQQATAALPDTTIVLGPANEIRWANLAARAQLGVRWPKDKGQRLNNLLRRPEVLEILAAAPEDSAWVEIESPIEPGMFLSIGLVPYGDDQRLFMARDVTRLHRLNQVRSDFVANVSHELRTPLTVFTGYLESLGNNAGDCPERWRPVLAQLQEQADRMQQIVTELLLLANLEKEDAVRNPRLVVVPEMIGDIHKQAQALSGEKRHIFYLEVDAELWVLGDQAELHSAFSNVVFNAVRYSPAHSIVRIRWYRDDSGAHFSVQDNGVGIPPQDLSRITERFYRVDKGRARSQGGTGLGLAIVKHVLQRHQGELHIESTVGRGSLFRCDLPARIIVPADVVDLDELA